MIGHPDVVFALLVIVVAEAFVIHRSLTRRIARLRQHQARLNARRERSVEDLYWTHFRQVEYGLAMVITLERAARTRPDLLAEVLHGVPQLEAVV